MEDRSKNHTNTRRKTWKLHLNDVWSSTIILRDVNDRDKDAVWGFPDGPGTIYTTLVIMTKCVNLNYDSSCLWGEKQQTDPGRGSVSEERTPGKEDPESQRPWLAPEANSSFRKWNCTGGAINLIFVHVLFYVRLLFNCFIVFLNHHLFSFMLQRQLIRDRWRLLAAQLQNYTYVTLFFIIIIMKKK